ncbi:MAG: site-2 protease family protein [Planctomycetota bacterium]|jgi:stage IV sporulation protein FB
MLSNALASHSLGRVLGIEVRITYLLYLMVGFYALTSLPGGPIAVLLTLIALALMMACVFLHEMGHSLAAIKEGVGVRAIFLHPLGGVAQLNGLIPGPGAEIFVALAGPAVSLFLAGVCMAPALFFGVADPILPFVGKLNLMLGLFNLLPIFPMDGGRVLTALLVLKYGAAQAIPLACRIARIGTFGLGGLGLVMLATGQGGFSLILIAVVLYFMGGQELQARQHVQNFTSGGYGRDGGRGGQSFHFGQAESSSPQRQPGWIQRTWNAHQEKKAQALKEAEAVFRAEVDEVLRKVHREGIGNLTPEERELLNEASRRGRQ